MGLEREEGQRMRAFNGQAKKLETEDNIRKLLTNKRGKQGKQLTWLFCGFGTLDEITMRQGQGQRLKFQSQTVLLTDFMVSRVSNKYTSKRQHLFAHCHIPIAE